MPNEIDRAHQLAKLENEVLDYRGRIGSLTRNSDESAGTSLQGTPEYAIVINALTKYVKRIRAEMLRD